MIKTLKPDIESEMMKIAVELSDEIDVSDPMLMESDFLDEGLFDSFQLIEFVTRLEAGFQTSFSIEMMLSDEFRTFKGIAGLVADNRCI